jgi:hypothetical protein
MHSLAAMLRIVQNESTIQGVPKVLTLLTQNESTIQGVPKVLTLLLRGVSTCVLICVLVPALARQRKIMPCPGAPHALAHQQRHRIAD